MSDEALARQLQRQLDMEDAALAAVQHDREPPGLMSLLPCSCVAAISEQDHLNNMEAFLCLHGCIVQHPQQLHRLLPLYW